MIEVKQNYLMQVFINTNTKQKQNAKKSNELRMSENTHTQLMSNKQRGNRDKEYKNKTKNGF